MRAIESIKGSPRTVPAGTPLEDVAKLMADEGLRAVVVTEGDGAAAGIVTERDLVVRALARKLPAETPVEAVMTSDLITAAPTDASRSIYRLLREHGIRQVPLVESDRVVGVVTRDDLADEASTEVLANADPCPGCGGRWLRPVSTADATNFLCLWCRGCWHIDGGAFVRVETRGCRGCPEHNFCRFPLIDYGVDPARLPSVHEALARLW